MICKDCELDVKKLNRKGVCPSCAHRIANSNWKGEKYIPIKDLKGTHGYNIAIAKRLNSGNAKITSKVLDLSKTKKVEITNVQPKAEKTITKIEKEKLADMFPKAETKITETKVDETKNEQSRKDQCYEIVLKDSKAEFKKAHLDLNFYKNINMKEFLSTLTELLYNKNIYDDAKMAEKIFNKLSIDYDHWIEDTPWDSEENQIAYGTKKACLELRRPNQTFIYNYSAIKEILDYLRKDTGFMKILESTKKKVQENQPEVYGARASELVASKDFATKRNEYLCEVDGTNLRGTPGWDTFRTTISAIDEQNALNKLNELLARKFSTFEYSQKNIRIYKI